MSTDSELRATVNAAVKRVALAESRVSAPVSAVADDEPLNGELLAVTSVGFLGMLMQLEDECGIVLPDDMFVGRQFTTVADLVEIVFAQADKGGSN
jgi:acyl carrier protein